MIKKNLIHSRKKGFTLIELLVGMTIFTVGITSIFLLLESTFKSASISRSEVIVANLLREQTELIRNIKENNYKNFAKWDSAKIENPDGSIDNYLTGGTFIVENNFTEKKFEFDTNGNMSKSPVKIVKKNFSSNELKDIFNETRLCFDDKNFYVHCIDETHKTNSGTIFATYTKISEMKYDESDENSKIFNENSENQAYTIDARVIVKNNSTYREYDAKTIITNWMK